MTIRNFGAYAVLKGFFFVNLKIIGGMAIGDSKKNKWSIRHYPDRRSLIVSLGELPKLDEN